MEKVNERQMLPDFRLESIDGRIMGPSDYRGKKNLVLVFFDAACISCRDIPVDFAERYSDYQDADTEILAVGIGPKDAVSDVTYGKNLPFPVLVDTNGDVLRQYADESPAIFAADRYGEIRVAHSGDDADSSDQDFVLDRVNLAELECPECGVPTWVP
ncbi:MAG: redoxin domain-containing protein [Armatimonadota bacterium]